MNDQPTLAGYWRRLSLVLRAIVIGLLVGMVPANVWLFLLLGLGTRLKLGVPMAVGVELIFLTVYICWANGTGPPQRWKVVRTELFRAVSLSGQQWFWGIVAAVFFAATVHTAIVVLFRLVPFPAAEFHKGYDLSFIQSPTMQWLAVAVSAISAGICEEIGFRGYMQRPIEKSHGALIAILVSSLFFMLLHLSKGWAVVGMVPIVFGAGVLLGTLAWASNSLLPGILGHTLMDIGLFAYWWTGIAGTFHQRVIAEAGMDLSFVVECALFAVALGVTLLAAIRLRRTTKPRRET